MSDPTSSDEQLRTSVLQALAANGQTAVLGVRVGVLNAIVHLGGAAPSQGLWDLAEAVAAEVAGVRGVVNRIETPGAPSPLRKINIALDEPGKGEA